MSITGKTIALIGAMLALSPLHASLECSDSASNSKLYVTNLDFQGEQFDATLEIFGQEAKFVGTLLSSSSTLGEWSLEASLLDAEGKTSELSAYKYISYSSRCTRAGCFGEPVTHISAELSYLGDVLNFKCHETNS